MFYFFIQKRYKRIKMSDLAKGLELTIGEVKRDFINYFDNVKFEVDIKAQELLAQLSDGSIERAKVLKVNLKMIELIEKLFEANMARLNDLAVLATIRPNENSDQYDKEAIKTDLAAGSCVFIRSEELDKSIKIDNRIGLIILTDWYLDENQLNYIK
jgi:hypothetical protein